MSSAELDAESLRRLVRDTISHADFRRATFGGPQRSRAPAAWVRVVVRPVELRGERQIQFSYFDARKDITKNYPASEVAAPLDDVLAVGFAAIHLSTATEDIDIRTTKKGKILVGRRKREATESNTSHNRLKNLPLPEGRADRLLEALGIATRDGHIRPTMRAKYTQINEFLKHLQHVLDDAGLRPLGRDVQILDCGCGASYLTLAAHHYLNDILGIPTRITGVDVNAEVIRKSAERSRQLGADRLSFACSQIGALDTKPDVVVALHACDTATDDAIAKAVTSGARLLMCVPCCHHQLNAELRPEGPAVVLRPLLRHGILRERAADLATDAFRALALRIMGYRTDVVEFVSLEHTARNLMIRAVRGAPVGEPAFVREYLELRQFWGVTPYIETALGERFQQLLMY